MSNTVEITMHSLLIQEAARWMSKKGASVIITDMTHGGPETADVIGWKGKLSTVIECKASVADFRADGQKVFRRYPEMGMGCFRYYCAPVGLLQPEKLPPTWGLLEWDGKKLKETQKPDRNPKAAAREEVSLLLSAIRRIGGAAPKGVSVRCYTLESKNRATIGIAPL
jgi:hypothetical protein